MHLKLGEYDFSLITVSVFLREGCGANFNTSGLYGAKTASIALGADTESWDDLVSAAMHELTELYLCARHCRYSDIQEHSGDHSEYLFIFKHGILTDMCSCIAQVCVNLIPDLNKKWPAWKKKNGDRVVKKFVSKSK